MRWSDRDEFLAWDQYDMDRRVAANDEVREYQRDQADDEAGWLACRACGIRTPNCHCPDCGARLSPPRSVIELRWMCHHGHEPTTRDLARHGVTMDDLPPVRGAEPAGGQLALGEAA
jgi:hypothetical protein